MNLGDFLCWRGRRPDDRIAGHCCDLSYELVQSQIQVFAQLLHGVEWRAVDEIGRREKRRRSRDADASTRLALHGRRRDASARTMTYTWIAHRRLPLAYVVRNMFAVAVDNQWRYQLLNVMCFVEVKSTWNTGPGSGSRSLFPTVMEGRSNGFDVVGDRPAV